MDESGVPSPSGGTSHFVLLGVAVPLVRWKALDKGLSACKAKHHLADQEVHTAWMARHYPEQERIPGFDKLTHVQRRSAVQKERKADLAKASVRGNPAVRSLSKNYRNSAAYIHLTHPERTAALGDLADTLNSWTDCVLFADVQDKSKTHDTAKHKAEESIGDHAFEQLVTRFHTFLKRVDAPVGLIVYDQNQAISTRLTERMRRFHVNGTAFSAIPRIVETPLFVSSTLTSMVQVADIASYATRRYIENQEGFLFDKIYPRFDRANGRVVGVRHYVGKSKCECRICQDHR